MPERPRHWQDGQDVLRATDGDGVAEIIHVRNEVWNGSAWVPEHQPTGGSGGTPVPVNEDGVEVVAEPTAIDFLTGFDVTDVAGVATINIDESELSGIPQSAITDLGTDLGNKQPADQDLTDIAALTATSDNFIQSKSSAWASRTPAQVIADLAALGTTFQPLDSDLTSIAALGTDSFGRGFLVQTSASSARTYINAQGKTVPVEALGGVTPAEDKLPYFTSTVAADVTTLTAAARTVLDDTTTADMLTTLGAQPVDTDLTSIAALTTTSFGRGLLELANQGALLTAAGAAAATHSHAESDITNLVTDLGAKAPIDSPTFTTAASAPTPATDDNDTSIATTAHVRAQKSSLEQKTAGWGLIAETHPFHAAPATLVITASSVFWSSIGLKKGSVIGHIVTGMNALATGNTAIYVGVATASGATMTVKAVSADVKADFQGGAARMVSSACAYTVPADGLYYLFVHSIGGTSPSLSRANSQASLAMPSGVFPFGVTASIGAGMAVNDTQTIATHGSAIWMAAAT